MSVDLFYYTNKGARELNEDYFSVKNYAGRCIAVLCDGLGGHNCGEVASKNAAENITRGLMEMKEINSSDICNILKAVNTGLINHQNSYPEFKGMRTTAVGCVVDNNIISYFNVGDSRFYFFRNGELKYMTKDHSVSQMSVELGEIAFDDIRHNPDRNKLLKVLGENCTIDSGTIYKPIECRPGDAFLMCSDGFWEYVFEQEMEIDLSKSESCDEWIKYMLVRLFLNVDGTTNDNFTVIGGIIE